MTAMPEAKLAREAELPYAAVAMVTDYDCWREETAPVEVGHILAVLAANADERPGPGAPPGREPAGRARALADRHRARRRPHHRAGGPRSGDGREADAVAGRALARPMNLAAAIRTIPDHPKPGILFRDITTLLADARAFRQAVDELVEPLSGIERRQGRRHRGARLHPRRRGRPPARRRLRAAAQEGQAAAPHRAVEYALEYGADVLEMHLDAVLEGERVMLVDDLIATGGTALAAIELLTRRRRRDRRRRLRHRPAGSRRRRAPARRAASSHRPGRLRRQHREPRMKLECFPMAVRPPEIVPGRPQRAWMDAFSGRHPYRCLPMAMANSTGWEILCPVGFTAEWNGGIQQTDIIVTPDHPFPGFTDFVKSHFSHGVLTFHPGLPVPQQDSWSMWAMGPPNHLKDGIQPLVGLIETDWLPFPFTMNWVFTRPGRVSFVKGEPFCFITLVQDRPLEDIDLVQRSLDRDLGLKDQYEAWRARRDDFNARLLQGRPNGRAGSLAALLLQGRDARRHRRRPEGPRQQAADEAAEARRLKPGLLAALANAGPLPRPPRAWDTSRSPNGARA